MGVPFFSDFPPCSNQFHSLFLHCPECIFGNSPQFPIFPHFPPFSPISPHFPLFPPISPHFPPFSPHFAPFPPTFAHCAAIFPFSHFSEPLRLLGQFGCGQRGRLR